MARLATTGWLGRHKVTKNVETTRQKVKNSLFMPVFCPPHGKHRQNTTRPLAPKDASVLPSGLQGQKPATRRAPKLLQSNCQSSAEKLAKFSAEVGQLLWKGGNFIRVWSGNMAARKSKRRPGTLSLPPLVVMCLCVYFTSQMSFVSSNSAKL